MESLLVQTVTPPPADNFWQYLLFFLLAGGGAAAIKQVISAYDSWTKSRSSKVEAETLSYNKVVDSVVDLLQEQLKSQAIDYRERLESHEAFFNSELEKRQTFYDENVRILQNKIDTLQKELESVRRELAEYYNN